MGVSLPFKTSSSPPLRVWAMLALVVTVQDAFGLYRDKQVINTPTLKSLAARDFDARWVRVGLAWTFGNGKKKDPGFDFQSPGGGPQ